MSRICPITEDRREPRWPISLPCRLRWTNGLKLEAQLADITTTGCRVRFSGPPPRLGYLLLSFGNFDSFDAEIVWTKDGEAGLAFRPALHMAVLDHIVRSNPAEPSDENQSAH
ncbi:PilZ domain-containing protein [Chakrabartia godavariana]|nr:PilZ domain-containing protein [Chakrabartia godavariana]